MLLLDNNVFTSRSFNASIDEIKELGFGKGEFYIAPNEYNIAVAGIRGGYNARACIKRVVKMYDSVITKLTETGQREFYIAHNGGCLLYTDTANAGAVLAFDEKFAPLYEKYFYAKINNPAASSGVCCFGKVFASGFNTADLWSDLIAPRGGVLNPSHTIKSGADGFVTSTVRRGKSFCEAAFGKT